MPRHVVLSFGLGIDSTGILVRWLTDPASRDFPLSALTVLVSQLGDEYPDTYLDLEQVILPLLHRHRVRLVQVARPALTAGRGGPRYVVLDDRTSGHHLVRRGPVRYSDELRRNGTIPQLSNRRCSLRWKGDVLDAWIADNIPPGFTHVLGYDAGELTRSRRDAGIIRHGRRPDYPLQRWGWHRDTTRRFLYDVTGRWFNRSCCAQCPFQTEWAPRWRRHPQSGADALKLEYIALALNPRMRLFGRHSAWSLAAEHQLDAAVAAARSQITAAPWAAYEVRRTFTRPNAALRSVQTLAVGTDAAMRAAVAATAALRVDTDPLGVVRAWLRPSTDGYPRAEHLIVAGPAGVADKERPAFRPTWDALQTTDADSTDSAAYCSAIGSPHAGTPPTTDTPGDRHDRCRRPPVPRPQHRPPHPAHLRPPRRHPRGHRLPHHLRLADVRPGAGRRRRTRRRRGLATRTAAHRPAGPRARLRPHPVRQRCRHHGPVAGLRLVAADPAAAPARCVPTRRRCPAALVPAAALPGKAHPPAPSCAPSGAATSRCRRRGCGAGGLDRTAAIRPVRASGQRSRPAYRPGRARIPAHIRDGVTTPLPGAWPVAACLHAGKDRPWPWSPSTSTPTDRPLQPYRDGQQLTAAISTYVSTDLIADPHTVADWAFALANQDLEVLEHERDTDDGETAFLTACLYRLFGNRSLSVGDVVHVQHDAQHWWLACEPTGWRHIAEPVHRSSPGPFTDRIVQLLHTLRSAAASSPPRPAATAPSRPSTVDDECIPGCSGPAAAG